MMRELFIRAAAKRDLAHAHAWYEKQRQGLGAELLLAVEAGLQEVQRRTGSFPAVYENVHRAIIKRFPYGIYFLIEPNRIVVIAVFHAKRNPLMWRRRR